ncbi:MAG: ornithine carbamoyltransferase [Bacilli bacterium]|nr:ornithine carbamoyltransferase [Bacilli bacterium]
MPNNLLTLQNYSKDWIEETLAVAGVMKSLKEYKQPLWASCLANKNIVLYFEKPSLRTHLTFEIAVKNLGGNPIYYDNSRSLGRESDKDMIKNISKWGIDAIVARVYKQKTLETFIEYGNMPIINALSDLYHPCQALADYMTIKELTKKDWKDLKIAYIGEPNNVSNSLMICGAKLGIKEFSIITPKPSVQNAQIYDYCESEGLLLDKLFMTSNIKFIKDYDVIYTDTWLSMGDNTPMEEKISLYKDYQVNQELLNELNIPYVLHCLPAHRGQEITDEVIDSHEEIYQQAENRLWTEMAVLYKLFK